MDKLMVKILTGGALTTLRTKPPSCLTTWPEKTVNLRGVSFRYSMGMAVPTDFGSHYRLIMHRAMMTNPHSPTATSCMCRLCGAGT